MVDSYSAVTCAVYSINLCLPFLLLYYNKITSNSTSSSPSDTPANVRTSTSLQTSVVNERSKLFNHSKKSSYHSTVSYPKPASFHQQHQYNQQQQAGSTIPSHNNSQYSFIPPTKIMNSTILSNSPNLSLNNFSRDFSKMVSPAADTDHMNYNQTSDSNCLRYVSSDFYAYDNDVQSIFKDDNLVDSAQEEVSQGHNCRIYVKTLKKLYKLIVDNNNVLSILFFQLSLIFYFTGNLLSYLDQPSPIGVPSSKLNLIICTINLATFSIVTTRKLLAIMDQIQTSSSSTTSLIWGSIKTSSTDSKKPNLTIDTSFKNPIVRMYCGSDNYQPPSAISPTLNYRLGSGTIPSSSVFPHANIGKGYGFSSTDYNYNYQNFNQQQSQQSYFKQTFNPLSSPFSNYSRSFSSPHDISGIHENAQIDNNVHNLYTLVGDGDSQIVYRYDQYQNGVFNNPSSIDKSELRYNNSIHVTEIHESSLLPSNNMDTEIDEEQDDRLDYSLPVLATLLALTPVQSANALPLSYPTLSAIDITSSNIVADNIFIYLGMVCIITSYSLQFIACFKIIESSSQSTRIRKRIKIFKFFEILQYLLVLLSQFFSLPATFYFLCSDSATNRVFLLILLIINVSSISLFSYSKNEEEMDYHSIKTPKFHEHKDTNQQHKGSLQGEGLNFITLDGFNDIPDQSYWEIPVSGDVDDNVNVDDDDDDDDDDDPFSAGADGSVCHPAQYSSQNHEQTLREVGLRDARGPVLDVLNEY